MQQQNRIDITDLANHITKLDSGACEKFVFEMNGKKYVFKYNLVNVVNLGYSNSFNCKNYDIVEVFSFYFLKNVGCDFGLF